MPIRRSSSTRSRWEGLWKSLLVCFYEDVERTGAASNNLLVFVIGAVRKEAWPALGTALVRNSLFPWLLPKLEQ